MYICVYISVSIVSFPKGFVTHYLLWPLVICYFSVTFSDPDSPE